MYLKERANIGLHDFLFKLITAEKLYVPQMPLLDIGCGSGAWLSRFPDASIRIGLDLDVAQFGAPNAQAFPLNIDNYIGEIWGNFQLITAFEIIEHLENPGNLFRLIRANLAIGGLAVLSTPNIHAMPARIKYLLSGRLPHFDNKSDATHIYPVYMENLERVIHRYGFAVQSVHAFPEKGSNIYSGGILTLYKFFQHFLPDQLRGDNLVVVIKRI